MKIIAIICGISLSNLKLVVCKFITETNAPMLPVGQSLCSAVPLYHIFSFGVSFLPVDPSAEKAAAVKRSHKIVCVLVVF